ncbi:MAG TPA: cupin domain-containing protein [Vicinamibacteria bacterium]|jgi:quercetin dioxygenase-like cupin family protein|nr:cupin domain-containing protein [Vicinamibacteria bacterium]
MNRSSLTAVTVIVVFATFLTLSWTPALDAQQAGAKRTILTKQDLSNFPAHEGVVAQVEFTPGAREPKHTHPGDVFGYVHEGTLTVSIEGRPTATVKSGEVFFVPAGKVHWAENAGETPVKVLATFVVEKGKPLTSPAQ